MSKPLVLDLNNIEVIYNNAVQVLRGLSLQVPRGEIVALLGSNGAGKSTTLKAISKLLSLENGELTGGTIRFNDRDTAGLAPHELVRAGLFHVMEGRRVFEDLTVEENLVAATYALNGRGGANPDFDLVYEYFPRLFERRRGLAGYLSGGEQQMLAIGRALIARPTLILLDEPRSAWRRCWSRTFSRSSPASMPSKGSRCCWLSKMPQSWRWRWPIPATSWKPARW